LRTHANELGDIPLPGGGATLDRWRCLAEIAREDLSRARLAEGHVDALAILHELGRDDLAAAGAWGVWAAEPAKLEATRRPGGGWALTGEKRWCSGSTALDHALVVATASDGPRLFVVSPAELRAVPGSWAPLGMEATASETMCFALDVADEHAVGDPHRYVRRPGFWHGSIGVAACWFGGAVGVADRLWRQEIDEADRPAVLAARGRVRARLDAVRDRLGALAHAVDATPLDVGSDEATSARLSVEETARAVLDDVAVHSSAAALAFDREHAQRAADLTLYIRQLHRGRDEQALGCSVGGPGALW
jgi:alkylation response protein AidB-like acyl-CoA dehydrogenase